MNHRIEMKQIIRSGREHTLPAKNSVRLNKPEQEFCLVRTGYLKRYLITKEGKHSVQSIYGPGDAFPLTPVFKVVFGLTINDGNTDYYYETITPTVFHSISVDKLVKEAATNSELYKDLLYISGQRLRSNIQKLENISLKDAEMRVANMLVHFAKRFGVPTDKGIMIKLPLTHELLAELLNVARETVSVKLTELSNKGLLISGKNMILTDVDKLRDALN